VLRSGDRQTYEQLLTIYREASLHEEKDRVASALGASKNPEILQEVRICPLFLCFSFTGSKPGLLVLHSVLLGPNQFYLAPSSLIRL